MEQFLSETESIKKNCFECSKNVIIYHDKDKERHLSTVSS